MSGRMKLALWNWNGRLPILLWEFRTHPPALPISSYGFGAARFVFAPSPDLCHKVTTERLVACRMGCGAFQGWTS